MHIIIIIQYVATVVAVNSNILAKHMGLNNYGAQYGGKNNLQYLPVSVLGTGLPSSK